MEKLRDVVSAGQLLVELNDMVSVRIAEAGRDLQEVLPTIDVARAFTDGMPSTRKSGQSSRATTQAARSENGSVAAGSVPRNSHHKAAVQQSPNCPNLCSAVSSSSVPPRP